MQLLLCYFLSKRGPYIFPYFPQSFARELFHELSETRVVTKRNIVDLPGANRFVAAATRGFQRNVVDLPGIHAWYREQWVPFANRK